MAVKTFQLAYLILEEDTSQFLEFQMIPDSITITKSAEWAQTEVVGRSEPYRSYRSSSPRSIGFTLRFFASVDQYDTGDAWEDVKRKADWLESLLYPDDNTGFPPITLMFFGNTIQSRCLVRSVNITYDGPWAFTREVGQPGAGETAADILPMGATVAMQLDEINALPRTAADLRRVSPLPMAGKGPDLTAQGFQTMPGQPTYKERLLDSINPFKI